MIPKILDMLIYFSVMMYELLLIFVADASHGASVKFVK